MGSDFMNRFRTAYAVFCVTLFLILPLFFYSHAVAASSVTELKSSGPTSAYFGGACDSKNYSVADDVYVTCSDGSYILSDGCYIARRFGGVAELGWRQETRISIISAESYTVTLGVNVLYYEPFVYCDIKLANDALGKYAIIGDIKFYCDKLTVSSDCYTTISSMPVTDKLSTSHGKPIKTLHYSTALVANDEEVRIDNGMIYVGKIGITDAFFLSVNGIIVNVKIDNSAYQYSNIESDKLTLSVSIEYDSYIILHAESCITVDLTGNIVFACSGVYTVEYIKEEYHTIVTYTVTIKENDNANNDHKHDDSNGSDGSNGENNSDKENNGGGNIDENGKPNISGGDNDENNNSADVENNGNNNETNDGEKISSSDPQYNFNITRQLDHAKIAMIVAFTLISAIGVIVLFVFLKHGKRKKQSS